MTDRELLELAAKAAGIEVTAIVAEGVPHRFGGGYWNPLTDDGDALRLAIKLELHIKFYRKHVDVDSDIRLGDIFSEETKHDPYAATRRAIVRASAAIGEQI